MSRSWMILGAGIVAPLAVGCGTTANPSTPVAGGIRTAPPYSVVAAPAPAPAPAPATQQGYGQPMNRVYTPAVVATPRVAAPVVAAAPKPTETVSMRVPTPEPAMVGSAQYQHSPDYTSLVGELHHNQRTGAWRLRYANVGEEDRYGGSVTLEAVGRMMNGYKTGQKVRVEGTMIDADSREISPSYRVRDVYPME